MHPILFTAFGIQIKTYGFFAAVGHILGVVLLLHLCKKRGRDPEPFVDLALICIIVGLLGARLSYFFTQNIPISFHTFFSLLQGGFSFYGGIAFVLPTYFFILWWRKLPVWETSDILAPTLPLAHAFLRIGCLGAGCCYGKPTTLPWGVVDQASFIPLSLMHTPLHPTQAYEASLLFILFVTLYWGLRKRWFRDGILAIVYFMAYAFFRFWLEFLRGDSTVFANSSLSLTQWIALFLFFGGTMGIWIRVNVLK